MGDKTSSAGIDNFHRYIPLNVLAHMACNAADMACNAVVVIFVVIRWCYIPKRFMHNIYNFLTPFCQEVSRVLLVIGQVRCDEATSPQKIGTVLLQATSLRSVACDATSQRCTVYTGQSRCMWRYRLVAATASPRCNPNIMTNVYTIAIPEVQIRYTGTTAVSRRCHTACHCPSIRLVSRASTGHTSPLLLARNRTS